MPQLISSDNEKPPLWRAEQFLKIAEQAYKDSLEFEERAAAMRACERRMIRRALAEITEIKRDSKRG